MTGQSHGWENYYCKHHDAQRHIVHEDAKRLKQLFETGHVNKILDLGCGDGRHLRYFSELGYQLYGFDISPTALHLAEDWLHTDGLSTELACGDMTALPWPTDFFDALVSVQVLNHGYLEEIEAAIDETYRVLKPLGWFYLCLQTGPPPDPNDDPSLQNLAPNTYANVSDDEGIGVPHYYFSERELLEAFSCFNLETGPYLDKRGKTCLLLRKPPK
jgi:SAM-dependent methyltransferase